MILESKNWTEAEKRNVWNKATIVNGNDSRIWRKDKAGAWINYDMYGNTNSKIGYGWQIDHIKPQKLNGSDSLDNLQPLQWHNNETKGDDYPSYKTSISSLGTKNIEKIQNW